MEPTVSSEMLAIRTQKPGNYPERKKFYFSRVPILYPQLWITDIFNVTGCHQWRVELLRSNDPSASGKPYSDI